MAAPARTPITDLPQGYEFPPTSFTLTRDQVAHYLAAVEDPVAIYLERNLCPPLAVVALALGSILELVELPPGALHTGQEVEQRAAVPIDMPLTLGGRVVRRSERAGLVISVLEFEVAAAGAGAPALVGRSTVLVSSGADL